ncbi:helix-turn-helix transcriptional regulator [Vibrio fluvialis]|nr:helix-turn-helix transcriptional regulator [Vibrio fluvialis]
MSVIRRASLKHPQSAITEWHSHQEGQLFWVNQGILMVEAEQQRWTVASGCLAWIPADCRHRTEVITDVEGELLYVQDATMLDALPDPKLIRCDDLITALLKRLSGAECNASDTREQAWLALLGSEISHAPATPLQLPLPEDKRARKLANYLIAEPENRLSQEALAERFGLSSRTLHRLFRQQTGMTFVHWRQQSRLLHSLSLLEAGKSITEVALASGYDNSSSYIQLFRQRSGVTPKLYLRQRPLLTGMSE